MTLLTICTILIGSNPCIAQSNNAAESLHFGKSIQVAQLSITATNNVIQSGGPLTIVTIITNASTNVIDVIHTGQPGDFTIALTNGEGKSYQLTEPVRDSSMRYKIAIRPGEQITRNILVTFGKNIEPGSYIIKASRLFWIRDDRFTLESNLLKVQVK